MERHTEFPRTGAIAWHLIPDCKGLVSMLGSWELGETDVMQRCLTIVSLKPEKF